MKKVCGLVIAILFIALVLFSGCVEKEEEVGKTGPEEEQAKETETEVKSACDDLNPCTKDVYNKLTNDCEFTMIKDCCGNDICETGERCNEDTHLTNCIEDCTRTCPAFLIVSKEEGAKESNVFSMSCGDSDCLQTDVNKFRITDSSSVKTTVTNIGERSSSKLFSNFMCWSGEEQAIVDGKKVYGVVFEDYYNENEDELNYLNPIQSKDNSATYYLSFDTSDKTEEKFLLNCKIFIRSTDFEKEQAFTLSFA